MKKAITDLENDHVQILRLIDVMEHIVDNESPDVENLEIIVDLIKNFADGLHHAKEEFVFFPFLAERGFSATQGPVAVMIHEHILGRNFVKGISDNISLYKNGDTAALVEIYRNMRGYSELLRSHISKENNILFRMADNVLSEEDNIDLLAGFKEAEKNRLSTVPVDDYIEIINNLVIQYDI